MSWKSAQEDAELLPKAIAAKDKEITSLCKNILTELGPESPDWDQAQRQATSCRMLLAIKRDGTVKCRLVKQGFKENLLEVDGPDFLYSYLGMQVTLTKHEMCIFMPKYIDNLYKSLSPLCKSMVDATSAQHGRIEQSN